MPYETFWNLNPRLIEPFRINYFEKQKESFEKSNLEAWLHGLYVSKSIGSCFSDKNEYPNKPLDFSKKEEKPIELRVDDMKEYMMSFNSKFKKNRTSVERQESGGDTDGSGQT